MSELLQSGHHPDADQLSAFIEHVLPAHEQEETLAHLAVCPHCRSIVALSLPPVEESLKPHPQPVRRPWLSGWNLAWPAAAAFAALVVVGILVGIHIRTGSIVRSHVPPTQAALSHPPATFSQTPPKPAVTPEPPRSVTQQTARLSTAAPVAKITPEPQAADRLMSVPGIGVNGRNFGQRVTPAPGASRAQGGALNSLTVSAIGGPAAAAQAQPSATISVTAGNQPIQTENPAIGGTLALDQAKIILSSHPLPSGLRALSTVANARQIIAIDTHNTLFFSDDAGAHWNVISPQWNGRAVKVEAVSSTYEAGASSAPVKPSPAIIGGAGSRDSVEGTKASLKGEVTDPVGAAIAGASVVVTNSLTQVARTTMTDRTGHYIVDNLDPGTYTLEAEAPGFIQRQISGVALNPAQQNRMDLTLTVGSVSQSVEVQGTNQPAPVAPRVKETIAATRAAVPPLPRFEITTDTGEHWTSTDGRSWKRE
jgi:hypothetical protein